MISFNTFDQTKEGIAAFFLCTMTGYLLYLLVEAPFTNLLTDFATRRKQALDESRISMKSTVKNDLIRPASMLNDKESNNGSIKDENSNLISIVRKEFIEEKKIN